MAAGNVMDADDSKWVPWAINGQLQAGRGRASLASSGLQAGIAGVGGLAAAAPGRSMAVSSGSWAERERLGRLAEAFGQQWARADGHGWAGQQRLDGRGLAVAGGFGNGRASQAAGDAGRGHRRARRASSFTACH
ncbi:hypothetical protein ACLOJK_020105 [Asimina triloba]